MKDINELRALIDETDGEIVNLILKRIGLAAEAGEYKRENGKSVYDAQREEAVIEKAASESGVYAEDMKKIFREIIRTCRENEEKGFSGLIGESVEQSLSPRIHEIICGRRYALKSVKKEKLDAFFAHPIQFLNITMPYKSRAVGYCIPSEEAKHIGAVNTVINKGGKLYGYNTDVYGVEYALSRLGISPEGKKVVIFGSGGASKSAAYAVRSSRETVIVSRSGKNNYTNLYNHYDADILINATPVGSEPDFGESIISKSEFEQFTEIKAVVDFVYNPVKTSLGMMCEEKGIPFADGLTILVGQAVKGEEFTGFFADADKVLSVMRGEVTNIALIGMPGAGKTTVGKIIAERTGREFYDSDKVIEEKIGRTPADIIEKDGEDAFRKTESETIKELFCKRGAVIALGGGAVLRDENRHAIRRSSFVVELTRETEKLETIGRPLSEKCDMEEMLRIRKPKYEAFSDTEIANNTSAEQTADKVWEAFLENTRN